MLSSYIVNAKSRGHEKLNNAVPSIFQIQEWIEAAWDQGINAQGRLETGGIKGTRKYIGTPEVCISCALSSTIPPRAHQHQLTHRSRHWPCSVS